MAAAPPLFSDRMSRPLAWLLGLLGLAVLTLVCVWMHASGIERDLQARTTAALDASGFTGTAVRVSGRDLTLSGAVPDDADRARALEVASSVAGVRGVQDALKIARDDGLPTGEAPLFSLVPGTQGALVVRGTVPDAAARQALLDRVEDAFPARRVQDELAIGAGASGWLPSLEALIPSLRAVDDPSLSVEPVPPATAGMDGAWIVLRGRVPSEAAQAEVESRAAAAVRAPYRLRSELVVDTREDAGDGGGGAADADPGRDPADASGSEDAQVQAADAALRDVLSSGAITFELATADLTARSRRTLDRVAEVLERYPTVRAEVQGHTDSEDSSEHNLGLSQQRAEAVRAYLAARGIDAARLTARGYGEEQPIATNDTAEGRALNRRVVFRLER